MRPACYLALLLPVGAMPAEMRSVEVDLEDGRYTMYSVAWFAAPPEAMFAVFSDYDIATKFSGAIAESRNLEPDGEGRPEFYVRNEGCVLFFCKSMERYGYLELDPPRRMDAITDPARSDFRMSSETWIFEPDGDGTAVHYSVEFVPKFWVPPIVGPYFIKRKLRSQGGGAIDRIEVLAQARQP